MNWKYIWVALLRRHIPRRVLFLIMELRGDSNLEEATPRACLQMWTHQLTTRGLSFSGKHILEIGSGRYGRFALQMLASGASRVTLIDPYAKPLEDASHRRMLIKDCEDLGVNFEELYTQIRVIPADITSLTPPSSDEKVDFVISHSLLEHVYDPLVVLRCCADWLKSGGYTFHFVDLRDHNFRFRFPFEMLTFSDSFWLHWLDLGGAFHLNRWRASHFLDAMRKVGFVNSGFDVLSKDEAALGAILPRLQSRFRALSESELSISTITLYGQQPSAHWLHYPCAVSRSLG